MTPEVVDLLRQARVPWVEGMRLLDWTGATWLVDGRDDAGWWLVDPHTDYRNETDPSAVVGLSDAVPDLTDRATFLLCTDELERRCPARNPGGYAFEWFRTVAPNFGSFDERERRDRFIALARALADSAPKEGG